MIICTSREVKGGDAGEKIDNYMRKAGGFEIWKTARRGWPQTGQGFPLRFSDEEGAGRNSEFLFADFPFLCRVSLSYAENNRRHKGLRGLREWEVNNDQCRQQGRKLG